jgi:DNA-binding NtrC family response regulator
MDMPCPIGRIIADLFNMDLKKKVLIVDDEEALLFGLQKLLSNTLTKIDTAPTIKRAVSFLTQAIYDIVITDLHLTHSSFAEGFEVIRCAREYSPQSRIIVITAYGDVAEKKQAELLGVTLFLEKPISPATIRDMIITATAQTQAAI